MPASGAIVIIGGGAAGMMAAIKAAETLRQAGVDDIGSHILLIDKNDTLGRKIYLTGKGRCNITNMRPWNEFSSHIHPNREFLKHAFHAFSNEDVSRFFEEAGVPVTLQQGQRLFPSSLRAADVARALEKRVRSLGVRVETRAATLEDVQPSPAVIIATGGKSYPVTGSTGDGYEMAAALGHTVTPLFPSETALLPKEYDNSLAGLEIKNAALSLYVDKDMVQREEGDFNFTEDGLESAIAYKISRKAVWAMVNGQKVEVEIDLKPALSAEKLAARIARDVIAAPGKPKLRNLLRGLMPEPLIEPFLRAFPGLSIENLPQCLKCWRMKIASYKGYERAVVTAGGVSLKEVSPKTMESKKVKGLYFAGEVLDIDGDTGGYNLQAAFSTGALAGSSAARALLR